jgi:hypothetical protein
MKWRGIPLAALAFLGLAAAVTATAQDSWIGGSLSLDRLAPVEPGAYLAGDTVAFTLDGANGNFWLRFRGSPEVFVLYADHGSLGGRILRYDSGETALAVAGWGGITLYTDAAPQGLPAVRTGNSSPPQLPQLSVSEMQGTASDEAERLGYVRGLNLQFGADWNALGDNPGLRSAAFVAMENTARGIERATGAGPARAAFTHRFALVTLQPGYHPTLAASGHTLIVTFNPGQGFAGCASSRAIARALGNLLAR